MTLGIRYGSVDISRHLCVELLDGDMMALLALHYVMDNYGDSIA
jgi:hypothetical protein